jgi:hypothetical protein
VNRVTPRIEIVIDPDWRPSSLFHAKIILDEPYTISPFDLSDWRPSSLFHTKILLDEAMCLCFTQPPSLTLKFSSAKQKRALSLFQVGTIL